MSPVTPDHPSRPGGVRADDLSVDRAAPRRRVPAPRAGESPRGRAPLPVAAGVAAGWAALTSYLPVAIVLGLVQLGADSTTLSGTLRTALAGWLVGHGVPLHTDAGPFGLAPLALTVLALWRLTRAGVHVSRAIGARDSYSPRRALIAAGTVGLAYALLGALAAVLVGTGGPDVSPVRAAVTFAVAATLAALVGATRTTAVTRLLSTRLPDPLRDAVRTGLVAALLLLGAGAGAAGLAVATGGGDAADMIGAYQTGVAGQAGITLVSMAYAPNAAIWSTSYLLGPGFAVGVDTAVRTSEVSVGALPAIPLLAGLPRGPVDGLGALLLAVPVLAGMVVGWLLARRMARLAGPEQAPLRWGGLLAPAALAGPVAGVLLGVAAAVSGGPLGAGRLAQVGPVAWQVGVVTAAVITAGALLGAAATRTLTRSPRGNQPRRRDPEPDRRDLS
ncbi:cell division protein PerM [Micromonospora profundi]|uniref:cell division protein PerM n=1 Tax=Micromonospora TaxID=1873 RepID=UPI0033B587B2